MPSEESPQKLTIELKNIQPLELLEMADCLLSFGAEYQRHLAEHEGVAAAQDVKLFVREVRPGSAIFDVFAAGWGMLPDVLDHGKSLLGFLGELKKVMGYLKREPTKEKPKLDKKRLERISRMVQPTAKDSPGAQINVFCVEGGGKIADTLTVNMVDANVIQNSVRREIEALREPMAGYHENAVLYFFQTRDDTRSETGDKAIIERLSKLPVRTKFATEEAKARVLGIAENIFRHAFIVDLRVETIDDKPVLYTVMRVHEVLPRPTQEDLPMLGNGVQNDG